MQTIAERVLVLDGELDLARRAEVRALLERLDDGEPLVIDLTAVEFIDLQTVLMLQRRRGATELRNAPPVVDRVLAALA